MRNRSLAHLFVGFFAVLSGPVSLALGQPANTPSRPCRLPPVLLVSYKSTAEDGNAVVLSKPALKSIGGREFVVGKIFYLGDQVEFVGKVIWIPVADITRLIEFQNEEEATSTLKLHGGRKNSAEEKKAEPVAIKWETDYEKARKEAARSGKALLLVCRDPDCMWSQKLQQEIDGNAKLAMLVNQKLIPLKCEGERYEDLFRALAIHSFPTLIVTDAQGKILHVAIGFQEAEKIVAALETTLAKLRSKK